MINWNIDLKYANILDSLMSINELSSNTLKKDVLTGNLPIGNYDRSIWKPIYSIFSSMNDENINQIPSLIDKNNLEIQKLDGEIERLDKRRKQLIEENNKYLQRPFGYFMYNQKLPKLKAITSNLMKLETQFSSQVKNYIDNNKIEEFTSLNYSLQSSSKVKEQYSISSISHFKPSLSLIFNICELSPSIIDILQNVDGKSFMTSDLSKQFKPREIQSLEYLDVLYCRRMLKENVFPIQNHQQIKSHEELENEFMKVNQNPNDIDHLDEESQLALAIEKSLQEKENEDLVEFIEDDNSFQFLQLPD